MTILGFIFSAASIAYLVASYWRGTRRCSLRKYAFLGFLLIAGSGLLLHQRGVTGTFLTPVAWTGFILTIDAAVFNLRGCSMLATNRTAFAWMATLSIPLWLVFEAYNLRLQNWKYVGLPENAALRCLGYLWSFATIWPAILETAEFILATRTSVAKGRPLLFPVGSLKALGAAFLIIPILVPRNTGSYLFGLVWLGFFFLLDPLNESAGRPSIVGDLGQGRRDRLTALLIAGVICGFFWELLNYWASAKWVYIFRISQQAKIFEMPILGYIGFPAFALEVWAMYVAVTGWLRVPYHEVR